MAERPEIRSRIDALFAAEMQAAHAEYRAVLRNDHAEAARCHAERWKCLDKAGELIERFT